MTNKIDRPSRNINNEEAIVEKRNRPAITERRILALPDRLIQPGYVYRWVNASAQGRVEYLKSRWWEVVTDSNKAEVGDKRVNQNTDSGSAYSVAYGGSTMILMRIKEEYHKEDKEAIQKEIDRKEADLRRSLRRSNNPDEAGFYGEVKIS